MTHDQANERAPGSKRLLRRIITAAGAAALVLFAYFEVDGYVMGRELVMASPDRIAFSPVSYATPTTSARPPTARTAPPATVPASRATKPRAFPI